MGKTKPKQTQFKPNQTQFPSRNAKNALSTCLRKAPLRRHRQSYSTWNLLFQPDRRPPHLQPATDTLRNRSAVAIGQLEIKKRLKRRDTITFAQRAGSLRHCRPSSVFPLFLLHSAFCLLTSVFRPCLKCLCQSMSKKSALICVIRGSCAQKKAQPHSRSGLIKSLFRILHLPQSRSLSKAKAQHQQSSFYPRLKNQSASQDVLIHLCRSLFSPAGCPFPLSGISNLFCFAAAAFGASIRKIVRNSTPPKNYPAIRIHTFFSPENTLLAALFTNHRRGSRRHRIGVFLYIFEVCLLTRLILSLTRWIVALNPNHLLIRNAVDGITASASGAPKNCASRTQAHNDNNNHNRFFLTLFHINFSKTIKLQFSHKLKPTYYYLLYYLSTAYFLFYWPANMLSYLI